MRRDGIRVSWLSSSWSALCALNLAASRGIEVSLRGDLLLRQVFSSLEFVFLQFEIRDGQFLQTRDVLLFELQFLQTHFGLPQALLDTLNLQVVVPRVQRQQQIAAADRVSGTALRCLLLDPTGNLRGQIQLSKRNHLTLSLQRQTLRTGADRHRRHQRRQRRHAARFGRLPQAAELQVSEHAQRQYDQGRSAQPPAHPLLSPHRYLLRVNASRSDPCDPPTAASAPS